MLRRFVYGLALLALDCRQPPPRVTTPAARSSSSSPASAALKSPFDVAGRRALIGRELPEPPAETVEEPISNVTGVSFYTDARHSVIDPQLEAANRAELAPLRQYVKRVTRLADAFVESRPARSAYAAQAGHALGRWARARALLGNANHQGEYEREWTLGGLALAYLKVQPDVDAGDDTAIGGWLCKIAEQVEPYYARPELESARNNHAY
ncbi:MAG TPA: alginate lyase family protein, partial [Polyangiaceae bacterium]